MRSMDFRRIGIADVTSAIAGGIIGVVVTVKDKSVSIRSADSKMEISKTAITEILERSGESSES